MNVRMRLTGIGMAAMLIVSTVGAAHANLIVNPGFEAPSIGAGTFSILSAIPGWSSPTIGGGIEIQNNVAGAPFAGAQHVELDSFINSNMIQSIVTVAGAGYNLSFAYSPRPGVAANSNGIDVLWDGGLLASLTAAGGGATSWTVFNYMVSASTALTALEFRATGISDSFGGYLDEVNLTRKVPEPATLTLFGLGLAGLGFARRRKAA